MKIGIDIDEVVAEFAKGFLKIYEKNHGEKLKFEDIFSYNLWEPLGITKEEAILLAGEFYESELFENIEIVEGAIEGINNLAENNEIFFITSRPETIMGKTESFLKKCFSDIKFKIIHSGDFWGGNGKTKAEICQDMGIGLMIEDNEKYSKEISENGVRVLLLDKPWNKDLIEDKNIVRVKNWGQILEKLK